MIDREALLKVIDAELKRQRPRMETWEECKAKMPLCGHVRFRATVTYVYMDGKTCCAETHGAAANGEYSNGSVSVSACPEGLKAGDKVLVIAHAFGSEIHCKFDAMEDVPNADTTA